MLMIAKEPEKKSFGVISITRVTTRCVEAHAPLPPAGISGAVRDLCRPAPIWALRRELGGSAANVLAQPVALDARRESWLRRRPGKAVTFALTLAAQRSEQKRLDRLVLASMKTPWQAAPAQDPSRSGPI